MLHSGHNYNNDNHQDNDKQQKNSKDDAWVCESKRNTHINMSGSQISDIHAFIGHYACVLHYAGMQQ